MGFLIRKLLTRSRVRRRTSVRLRTLYVGRTPLPSRPYKIGRSRDTQLVTQDYVFLYPSTKLKYANKIVVIIYWHYQLSMLIFLILTAQTY